MNGFEDIHHWLSDLRTWVQQAPQQRDSLGRQRLERAFLAAEDVLRGDGERLLHSFSRLGLWAEGLATEVRSGDLAIREVEQHLTKLAQFGRIAYESWSNGSHHRAEFDTLLRYQLIPDFCSNRPNMDASNFKDNSSGLSETDISGFLGAWKLGLMRHRGRGLYRAPKSGASEHFFWHGPRTENQTFSLWYEPIITVAALGKLHTDFGWPVAQIGTQSSDGAFDLLAFIYGNGDEYIAGEVKKSRKELDEMLSFLLDNGPNPNKDSPASSKEINAFKKLMALRKRKPPIFWAVGPDEYSFVYKLSHGTADTIQFELTDPRALRFPDQCNSG